MSVPTLAARGASPAEFGGHCNPPGCVAPPSNIPDDSAMFLVVAPLDSRRDVLTGPLGATPDWHRGLLDVTKRAKLAPELGKVEGVALKRKTK